MSIPLNNLHDHYHRSNSHTASPFRVSGKLPSTVIYTPPSPPSSGNSPSRSPSSLLTEYSHEDPWTDGHLPHSDVIDKRSRSISPAGQMEGSIQGLEGSWRTEMDDSTLRHRSNLNLDHGKYDENTGDDGGVWEPPIRLGESSGPLRVNPSSVASTSRQGMQQGSRQIIPVAIPISVGDGRKGKRPLPTAVWGNVTATSNGRDKVLKCVQYSLRTYLYLLTLITRVRPLSRWFKANQKRMKMATSGLSLTRKCLLFTNSLHPFSELLSPEPMSATTMLSHLIELLSAVSDDVYCLFKLGIVGKKTGKQADTWSNRLWFLSTLIGLYKLHLRTIPTINKRIASNIDPVVEVKADKELVDAKWTTRKLLADLIFVSYDIFNVTWFAEPVQCLTGLTAALISTSKVYDKHWTAGLGK